MSSAITKVNGTKSKIFIGVAGRLCGKLLLSIEMWIHNGIKAIDPSQKLAYQILWSINDPHL